MSADNWGICPNPKCTEPLDIYGENRTLREHYETGFYPEGTLNYFVNYTGECACGFTHTFKHEETVTV